MRLELVKTNAVLDTPGCQLSTDRAQYSIYFVSFSSFKFFFQSVAINCIYKGGIDDQFACRSKCLDFVKVQESGNFTVYNIN